MTEPILSADSVRLPKPLAIPSKRDMTLGEAKVCVKKINEHVDDAYRLVLELRDRNGWKTLGYASWIECAVEEFGKSKGRVYQLLQAAQIKLEIEGDSTMVENVPERSLRPLAALDTPKERQEAWKEAKATAPDGKPTASHVKETVNRLRGVVDNITNPQPKAPPPPSPQPRLVPHEDAGAIDDDEFEKISSEERERQSKLEAHKRADMIICPACGARIIMNWVARRIETFAGMPRE